MTTLRFDDPSGALSQASTLCFIGPRERLGAPDVRALLPAGAEGVWEAMLAGLDAGDAGTSAETWCAVDGADPVRIVACALPTVASRHNSPAQPHAIAQLAGKALRAKGKSAVLFALAASEHAFASACALARALPLYDRKGSGTDADSATEAAEVSVAFLAPPSEKAPARAGFDEAAAGIQLAARLVDMPASELHTDAYLKELKALADELDVHMEVIRGEELASRGYGGLFSVGRAALHPPALAVLSHEPASPRRTLCWVGKGIVYDTGGLSIKGKEHMPGMKADMGGSAAVAGAFRAAVAAGHPDRIHAIFCLAENSVGPESTRPDDVVTMYAGKTVEINNTDAEGRLVLADGVAHAVAHLAPDVIVDLATLTGAQLIATGKRHAAIVTNDAELEARAIAAGRASGDLVHPLPYVPEFYRKEFESKVADLKNSVKDRANAQSSCAAQFIAEHLGDHQGAWLHVDMAGPAVADERGTGFGVALLLELFRP